MNMDNLIKQELERNADTLFKIYFKKEGKFYRACEWSAYIAHMFPNNLSERLKPTKRFNKQLKQEIVKVGIPVSSLTKYILNGEDKLNKEEEIYVFDAAEYFKDSDLNIGNYTDKLAEWKKSLELTDDTKQKDNNNIIIQNNNVANNNINKRTHSCITIISDIAKYQLENKSPIQNIEFIKTLQEKVSIIFFG